MAVLFFFVPFLECLIVCFLELAELFFELGDNGGYFFCLSFVGIRHDSDVWRVVLGVFVEGGHRGVAEEGCELVVLLHRDGIEFMVVASGAASC